MYKQNIFKVLLIGKTNAGKSSLFNKLTMSRISVVDAQEHLTNDVVKWENADVVLYDSPGITRADDIDVILNKCAEIDLAVLVIDPSDYNVDTCRGLIYNLSRHKIDAILVVNKYDLKNREPIELSGIEVYHVSALNGHGINDLRSRLRIVNKTDDIKNKSWSVFGRANVGKSTLANALLKQNRFTVLNQVGTTREINRETMNLQGTAVDLIDTPGYRKNNRLSNIEKASQYRLENYISESNLDLGIMLIDGSIGITNTDKRILDYLLDKFRILVAINKSDLMTKDIRASIVRDIDKLYPNIPYVFMSASNSSGLGAVISQMRKLELVPKTTTGILNRWAQSLSIPELKYMTRTGPNQFILFVKRDLSHGKLRFVENQLSSHFGFTGMRLKLDVARS